MGAVSWSLAALLHPWDITVPPVRIRDVGLDSRALGSQSLFLALRGYREHGLAHLDQALARGAAAVLWEPQSGIDESAVARRCEEAGAVAQALSGLGVKAGEIAARFFGEPAGRLRTVGVTGTDGKSSTSQFISRVMDMDSAPWAVFGTLGWGRPDRLSPTTHTTPDAVTLQRQLAALVDNGITGVAMEVSSHALEQRRTAGMTFDVAVLTNLSRDHLDYHGTDAAYAAAKARLFQDPPPGALVLNLDDAFGRRLSAAAKAPVVGYSLDGAIDARVQAVAVLMRPTGLVMRLRMDDQIVDLTTPLYGRFNAANVLAVVAVMLALKTPREHIAPALARLRAVPGRMEALGGGCHPSVIVDYAHTPAALAAALAAVRAHFPGKLWCVCGCGGDRDPGKRPLMAAAAAQGADQLVFTSDNPRTESPGAILDAMSTGLPSGINATVIEDRGNAIHHAIELAEPGDAVLVAGKGHETYQIVGDRRLDFSDRAAVTAALAETGEAG